MIFSIIHFSIKHICQLSLFNTGPPTSVWVCMCATSWEFKWEKWLVRAKRSSIKAGCFGESDCNNSALHFKCLKSTMAALDETKPKNNKWKKWPTRKIIQWLSVASHAKNRLTNTYRLNLPHKFVRSLSFRQLRILCTQSFHLFQSNGFVAFHFFCVCVIHWIQMQSNENVNRIESEEIQTRTPFATQTKKKKKTKTKMSKDKCFIVHLMTSELHHEWMRFVDGYNRSIRIEMKTIK